MKVAILFVLVAITAVLCDERHPWCPEQEETERALIFPHESDLTKFYICATNGTLTEFQCVEGLEFDPEVNVCNWASLINRNTEE
ncbi:peritrophin-1-like [Bradysia coprophila]|uniref:peritrophin-1-like n=1 Tax=Bradysia coprophila TaxID=38358 RepID=UPI00187D7EF1|nr:peritrophin-1-like [Bradysia coprophila]